MKFTIEDNVILPVPQRDNFTFVGWHLDELLKDEVQTAIPVGTTGDRKFFAEWTMGNSVQISRPANGTITVMSGTTEVKSGDKVGANTSLTITATPASADYKLSKLVVNNTEYTTSPQTVKMPAEGGLTISAAFADPRPAASAPKITTDPVNTDYIPSGESVTVTMDKGGECDSLLYSIDALHTAISAGRLVQFRYKNNSTWTVSPWQLAWEGGCYYLIAYQDEKDPANIRNYRVDRMSYVKVLDRPRRGKEAFAAFDLPSYLRKHFNMFGGPEYRVTLRCTADLEAAMRDRFGRDVLLLPEADGHFHFDVPVCVSEQFYGWVCGFGGKVEITSPVEVRQGLHDMVQELAEQHN